MKLHDVLHMRRMNLVTAFVLSAFVLSCSDEEWAGGQGNEIPGQDVTVKLNFQVTTPEVKATTRVPSDNVVFDLYVLIFDAAGNKTGGGFFEELDNPPATEQPGTTGSDNYVTIDTKTGASYIYGFANVSGSVNEYVDNIKDRLDAVRTRDELLNLSVTLHSSIERAGNSYLMSGTAEKHSSFSNSVRKPRCPKFTPMMGMFMAEARFATRRMVPSPPRTSRRSTFPTSSIPEKTSAWCPRSVTACASAHATERSACLLL